MEKSIGMEDPVPSTRKRISINTVRPGLASAGENLIPSPMTTVSAKERENITVERKVDKIIPILKHRIFLPPFVSLIQY
jgi:hypothetical protein